jgi:hypothetical protein
VVRGVRDEADGDLVVVRLAPGVRGIAAQHRAFLPFQGNHLVGSRSDGFRRDVGAALLHRLLRDDASRNVADDDVEQVGARLREHDAALVLALDLDGR